jgi:hypothetical protein
MVAGLLAMRAVAPFVAPPAADRPVADPPGGIVAPAASMAAAAVATRPAPLAEATGASLILGGDGGLLRVDLDRRSVGRVALPLEAAEADNGLVERDGMVVAARGGVAYAASARPGWPATRLGPASYALASATPGRVWLVEETGDPARWFRLREVDLARLAAAGAMAADRSVGAASRAGTAHFGSPRPSASRSPAARGVLALGQRPVAAAPGGLLVHVVGAGGGLAVWDPRTGKLGRRLTAGATLAAVAARGRAVAWVEGSVLHLGDLATGRDRVVPAPPGTDGFAAPGAFSPDGRTLAAVTRSGFSTRPALALVAVARAAAVRVAGSDGALSDRCAPCLAWAPAGDWVFFGRLGPGFGIGAYRLGRPHAVTVPVDIPFSFPPSFAVTRPE